MGKELTTRESTEVALSKSKSFMGIIKNIFNNKIVVDDDSWMQILWDWADNNDIADLSWEENDNIEQGGYWIGLSRDKEKLLTYDNLILSEEELWELPKEIGNLVNLKSLYFDKNYLTGIPGEIGSLINLTQLNLSDNQLVELPKEIGNLINLKILYLYGNLLEELPKDIGALTSLNLLGLSENELTKLPKEIGNLVRLESLLVEECPLTELPKEIYKLVNLRLLLLAGSHLIHLPKEIGSLISLKELRLTHNNLKEIPKEIGNLTNLEKLYLIDNKLSHLPKEIGNLSNLKELYLAENNLTYLPKEIGNLIGLVELHLADNTLLELPEGIENLINLEALILSKNQNLALSEKQKEWISELETNGCYVDIDDLFEEEVEFNEKYTLSNSLEDTSQIKFDNLISKIYARDFELGETFRNNVEFVSYIDNKLTWSSSAKGDDKKLLDRHWGVINMFMKELFGLYTEMVNIDDDLWMQRLWDWADENDIDEDKLPRNKSDLTNCTELYLDDNNITELPKEIGRLANLTGLYLYENDMAKLPKEIVQLENLTDLNIALNNFTEVQEEIIQLKNLEVLNLYENRLVELPKAIGELSKLNMLILGDNDLTKLPKEIGQLQDLTRLILVYNYLTELPKEIGQLNNLIELNLRGNDLTGLPDEIINLTNLSILHIDGNPDLVFTQDQIKWIEELKISGCDIHLDDDVLEESKSIENLEESESKDTFTFDNGRQLWSPPRINTTIVECLYAIIHSFSDKKLCIQKVFNDIENVEIDIYYSLIGQKHLDYSGSEASVKEAKTIYEKEGSIGVCNSEINVQPKSYIEWRFDFYQNDICLEVILFENNTRTELYSRTLKNGPSELFDVYQMYIENGYKEAFKILDDTKEENDSSMAVDSVQSNINNIASSKYSNEEILGTSYNMIREVFEDSDGNKPISNHASFFTWNETISALKDDNGESLIKLDDGTGYAIAYDADKIIFIVKEIDGTPAFVNQQFYEKFYQEIYKNKNV